MKRSIHFNDGTETGAGAAAAESTVLDASVFAEGLSEISGAATEKKEETPTAETSASDKKEETPEAGTENATAEKPVGETPAAEETAAEAEAGEEDKLTVPALADDAKEDTWITVSERLGVEPPKDPEDFDGFENNVKTKIASEYQRGLSEGEAKYKNVDLEKFAPDAIPVINALQGGKKLADILVPLQGFNAALALSPQDRLTAYCTDTLKMTPDAAADQIAVWENTGVLAAEDAKLRLKLETARDATFNQIVGEGQKAFEARQQAEKAKTEAENKAVKEAIRSKKEFMGAPLTEEHYAALERNWDAGVYKKLMAEDPNAVAEFIRWKEFGEQRTKQLVEKTKKDTKLSVIKKQANTPNQQSGTKPKPAPAQTSVDDHLDPDIFKEAVSEMRGVEYSRKTA